MNTKPTGQTDVVFQWQGIPQPGQLVPLGLQHVVAAVVGIITPAMLIADVCGITGSDRTLMIQVSLLLTALATLLQLFPLFRRIGSGLPVVMGISFAYIPTLQAIGGQFGLPTILGPEIVGGVVAIVFGLFVKWIRPCPAPGCTGHGDRSPSACPSTPPPCATWPAATPPASGSATPGAGRWPSSPWRWWFSSTTSPRAF